MAEEKFMNKYRTMSHRLRGWDYSQNGHYFITIVTENRAHLFGEVSNNEMIMNPIGQIVYDEFFVSFEMRQELYLGAFVLMPNHLHAILILDGARNHTIVGANDDDVDGTRNRIIVGADDDDVDGAHNRIIVGANDDVVNGTRNHIIVETHGRASLQYSQYFPQSPQSPQYPPFQPLSFDRKPRSISSFVAGFKSATVNRIDDWIEHNQYPMQKFNRYNLLWQKNYYDHIIRNEREYYRIQQYIENNPAKWCSSHYDLDL